MSKKILISFIILLMCTGCMKTLIDKKYNLDRTVPYIQAQLEVPQSEPYKTYYVGTDIELKMNVEDYVIVRIDEYTFRFVLKTDVESRLRQQMVIPTLMR